MKTGCVYIMASFSKTLYIGVTSDPVGRIWEHRTGATPGFTSRYRCIRLVLLEEYSDINDAIAREKALKGWTRARTLLLIEEENPRWRDLWYEMSK